MSHSGGRVIIHLIPEAFVRGAVACPLTMFASDGELYLMTDAAGAALEDESLDAILPYVADAVELSGVLENHGDVRFLRIDLRTIRRL